MEKGKRRGSNQGIGRNRQWVVGIGKARRMVRESRVK
jgi:hypothetical protein